MATYSNSNSFLFGTVCTKCRTLTHKEQAQRQTKNSINYTTLMSCINKCIQYNQTTFQCVVVVFTSVRNGMTKGDKSRRAWSTHCNKVSVGRLCRVELIRHSNIKFICHQFIKWTTVLGIKY